MMRSLFVNYMNLDRLGILLSSLCAVHCLLTPFVLLSLPIMGRYYLAHPYFHVLMAILILPVGVAAFLSGYKHHHKPRVFVVGIPGLFLVSMVPVLVHNFGFSYSFPFNEATLMLIGSCLVIWAHWLNKKSCATCQTHSH